MDLLSHLRDRDTRDGDTLVVWRLDRLGRSLPQLLQTVEDLAACGVGFKSLTEAIDITTSRRKLIFSYLRRTRRIRTRPDPRTHPSRPRRRTSPHRRPAPEDDIDETRTGTTYAGKWNASHRRRTNHSVPTLQVDTRTFSRAVRRTHLPVVLGSSTSFALGIAPKEDLFFSSTQGTLLRSTPRQPSNTISTRRLLPRSVVIQLAGVLFIVVHGRFSLSFSWPTSIPTTPERRSTSC